MSTVPTVRLTLEGLRYQVLHVLGQHHEEIEKNVEEIITQELNKFDFSAIVREEFKSCLQDALKKAIANAVGRLMYEAPIYKIIADGAAQKVRQAIEESLK